jgi:methylmalonyl-CoA/ethylmalonyl-CoA epimerase
MCLSPRDTARTDSRSDSQGPGQSSLRDHLAQKSCNPKRIGFLDIAEFNPNCQSQPSRGCRVVRRITKTLADRLKALDMNDAGCAEARLHHIGFVVLNIQKEVTGIASSIGANWDMRIFLDPLQKVRVTFLEAACANDAQIELVEPLSDDSPVVNFLRKGGGLHHLCYEVNDLEAHLHKMRKAGNMMVKPPLPAVAFENRRIAWVFTRQKLLLEFLQQRKI